MSKQRHDIGAKKARAREARAVHEVKPSLERLAESLVRRGLATADILDSSPYEHTPRKAKP